MPILVHHDNQQLGPYPEATARQMLADGRLPPTALAWREGMAEWKPLGELLATLPAAAPAVAVAASGSALKWGLAAGGLVAVLALGGIGAWQYGEHQKLQLEKQRIALEQQRLEEEQARAEEQRRMEEQQKADAERQRLEDEKKLAEEKNRELEQRLAEERQQLARERQQRASEQRAQRVYQTPPPAPRQQQDGNFPYGSANPGYGNPGYGNPGYGNPGYGAPPPPANVCRECGTVQYVRAIEQPGQGTGMGAVIGGVAGGVLGNQIGKGRGNDAATVIGAVGGAVAGHQIEKSQRRSTVYEVQVRFDDGTVRSVSSQQAWRQGDRVRLYNGGLVSQY